MISLSVIKMANRLDQFFADDRIIEETDKTIVRVTTSLKFTEGDNPVLRLSMRGRIALPYLEERLLLLLDSEGRDYDVRDQLAEAPEATEDDKSFVTGVRYLAKETKRTRVSVDGGLRWYAGPVPFARLRIRKTLDFDPWAVRLTQQFFWYSHNGFGETSRVDLERWLGEAFFFRSTSDATWSETSEGVDLSQGWTVYHDVSQRRTVAISFSMKAHTHPHTVMDEYFVQFRYRQRIHRDWMFMEVAPGAIFPRDRDWDFTPTVTLKLEVQFGDLPGVRLPFQ